MDKDKVLLQVKNLNTYFYTEDGVVKAVDGLDFELHQSETLAIVGESGCGKSVTSLSILRLIDSPPGKIADGEIIFEGVDLSKLSQKEMGKIRGNKISMIFQEPMTSLNPVFTIGSQVMDPLMIHQQMDKKEAFGKAVEMLKMVGIAAPEKVMREYPHQLSGGMRQRVMIAMAMACNPEILIADEPTTALDVTIQAQILRLIADLKEKVKTSVILITHDLGIVAQIADNIIVMYAGQAVESADVRTIFKTPMHPYTNGLLKSIPKLNESTDMLYNIRGTVPDSTNYPKGCRFCERCEEAMEICKEHAPALWDAGDGHRVRCWKYHKA